MLSICAANIEITEVFYDGNDEWIELTNTSNEIFSGEVVLSGAKSSSITLHLVFNPGEIKVIWDEGSMLNMESISRIGWQWLQLSDTSPWSVEAKTLLGLSTFSASKALIEQRNNLKTSLCRNFDWSVYVCSTAFTKNVIEGYTANPWRIDLIQEIPSESTASGDNTDIPITGDTEIFTGEEYVEEEEYESEPEIEPEQSEDEIDICAITGNSITAYTGVVFALSPLIVTEIQPFGTTWSYIELYSRSSYSGEITFLWAWVGSVSKTLSIITETWNYIVLSAIWGEWEYYIPGLSLQDGWEEIILLWQYGQVLDTILYTGAKKSQSSYFSQYSGSVNLFYTTWEPTPWENFFSVMWSQEVFGWCRIDQQRTTTYVHWDSLNFRAVLLNMSWWEASLAWHTCVREYGDGQGSTSCNPWYFKYNSPGIYTASLRITSWNIPICQTKSVINYVEEPEKPKAVTSTATKSVTQKQTTWSTVVTSWSTQKVKQPASSSVRSSDTDDFRDIFSWYISLAGVLADPVWTDSVWEWIALLLSGISASSLDGLSIKWTSKTTKLNSLEITQSDMYVITGAFSFRNSSGCIDLMWNRQRLDTMCYDNVQEWERIWKSPEVLSSSLADMSSNIISSSTSSSSTPTKKTTTTKSTTKTSASKSTTKSTDAKDKKIDQLNKELTINKRTLNLQKNYISLLQNEIEPYSSLFSGNKIQLYDRAYRFLLTQAKQNQNYSRHEFKLSVEDIRSYLSLVYNILPIESDLDIPYTKIWEDTRKQLGYIQSQLMKIK